MNNKNNAINRRILVIDDNEAIHADFRKILLSDTANAAVSDSYAAFFGEESENVNEVTFELDFASQGQEGLEKVCASIEKGRPYAVAFVDVRMPPGWDGIETIGRLWSVDPNLLVVICTAYNDYNWNQMTKQLGHMDHWLILRKPFDNVEVRQLAASLTEKWDLARKSELKMEELRGVVETTNQRLLEFRDAVDSAGIVAVTDLDGTILEANENFCKVSGYTHEELIGANHRIVKSGHHPDAFFEEMHTVIEQGKIWRAEVCNRAKNGELYWVDTTIVPMRDENQKVEGYFALRIEISERKRLMGRLQNLAYCDALTGLPNRASILRSIQIAIDRGDDSHFALLFLDFDRFKLINDSLGHDVGDELLEKIAQRLRETLRTRDQIQPARLGGDEFVVLLEQLSSPADATIVAGRLLQAFSQSYKLSDHTVYSTASIGVVTNEHRYELASDMLRDADIAMYKAKDDGKARYAIFDQRLREKAMVRLRIESELREAIAQNDFALVYQPIISLESGQMEGVEALVRWMHPERGMIGPIEFIPVAEETGIIVPLGNWVLNEACRQFSQWRHSYGAAAPPCIHINVSRKQLLQQDLVKNIEQALAQHAVPPECVHLEVTESMIMHDQKASVKALVALRELGLKIDMDDFGTGYSSLACLHEFPIDVLKIDRAFIANVKKRRDFAALLHAIVTMADNLGLQVVAEGIEDDEQLALLQAVGCEYGQGYFFAKPLPAVEIESLIKPKDKLDLRGGKTQATSAPANILADGACETYQGEVEA